ncbi:hypothetical protein CK501_11345 [Halovibrio salipaludis]|uniref:Uncharacterized protein n=1 Tax=Halovibrio salipaludis TaxID=2032626 RepID=A0A2A2F4R0_9GAMM|nr:hypothetical protein [Halovibrio salipaludis]PAU79790.1 hypothetical protein CK501_11345 [Halovibrio salipaludis]
MPRTADYTIQGFLYQFNKTALEILGAEEDDEVTVEGIVEDIEVATPTTVTAVQCKYHEASTSFTASAVYKPLLQMLKHFSDNQERNIRYVLFAHFSGVPTPEPSIDKATLVAALSSKDKELEKHIRVIPSHIDLDSFLGRFTMEFGPSYDEIVKRVFEQLEASEIPKGDIETLVYPNAIHMIATLSIKHDEAKRKITKKKFISDLLAIRKTAISRWTLALKTREKLIQARRKQLKINLDKNARLRYFIIDPNSIEDYHSEIVIFISDYIDKYHFKPAHINTPTFCLCADRSEIQDIQHRLYQKGIVSNDGYLGGQFEESYFFREPLISKGAGGETKREFSLRILSWEDHGNVLNNRKCDDLFIVGEPDCNSLDTVDVNVERLAGASMKEIKYVMGVSNVYE